MNYHIQVQTPATYTVWVRGMALEAGSDSVHLEAQTDVPAHTRPFEIHAVVANLTGFTADWAWSKLTMAETPAQVYLPSDAYTLTLSMREDGLRVDRLLLITDTNYIPTGIGPNASPIQTITNTTTPATTTQTIIAYAYDNLYRLTAATYTGTISATYAYAYDAVGNMVAYTETINSDITQATRTYDNANRLLISFDSELGTTSYLYDHNGNLLQTTPPDPEAPTQHYSYNQRNLMLATYTLSNGQPLLQAAFFYDGANNRLQQIDYTGPTPLTITYTNDILGLSQVLVANDGTDTTTNLFGYGLISQQTNQDPTQRYPLTDGLGSVRVEMVGDEVEATRTYAPYGELLAETGERGMVYGYTGEQEDASTGLLYLRARYYNPAVQSFMGKDPWSGSIQNPQSMNGWSYVEGNPVNFIDPSGMIPVSLGDFPEHCRLAKSYPAYGDCVRSHYALYYESGRDNYDDYGNFISDNIGSFSPIPTQGCYQGPIPYRGNGYIEGVSGQFITPAVNGGTEVVYDFASMQRQNFLYNAMPQFGAKAILGTVTGGHNIFADWIGNISVSASVGYLTGFRSWIGNKYGGITNDYQGWFESLALQGNHPTLPIMGSLSAFRGVPDYTITGVGLSFGVGKNILPPTTLSNFPLDIAYSRAYYTPISSVHSYSMDGAFGRRFVYPTNVVADVAIGLRSPLSGALVVAGALAYTGVGTPIALGFIAGSAVARSIGIAQAVKWSKTYNSIHYDSYIHH